LEASEEYVKPLSNFEARYIEPGYGGLELFNREHIPLARSGVLSASMANRSLEGNLETGSPAGSWSALTS
jgi:hypothetical protein